MRDCVEIEGCVGHTLTARCSNVQFDTSMHDWLCMQTMAPTNDTCVCIHPRTHRYEVEQEQKKARCSDKCLMNPMHTCRRYQCPLNQTKMHANQSSLYSREFYLNRSNHTYFCACHTDRCARMRPQQILLVSVCMRPNVCVKVYSRTQIGRRLDQTSTTARSRIAPAHTTAARWS